MQRTAIRRHHVVHRPYNSHVRLNGVKKSLSRITRKTTGLPRNVKRFVAKKPYQTAGIALALCAGIGAGITYLLRKKLF